MSEGSPSPEGAVPELIRQAKELRSQGQVADAVPLLERATRLDPTNIGAWAQLGYTLSLVNRFAEAAWAYQCVVELHPEDATSWRNLGYAFRMQQHPREALVAYDRAIALDPEHVEVWNRRATALQMLGRFDDMRQASERACALDVTNVRAWNNTGVALAGLKRYPEALEAFEHTLALDPAEASYWGNKAKVLVNLRRYKEGLDAIERALTLAPNDAMLWGVKTRILWRLRRFPQAVQAMAHTSSRPFTPRQLPTSTEEEELAWQEASTLRGVWTKMLLVPWRRMDPEAHPIPQLALAERVALWGVWLCGMFYLLAGLALSALWLSHSSLTAPGGIVGIAFRITTTGLLGLLAQALGAGMIVLLGSLLASPPEGTATIRTYLRSLLIPALGVVSILAIPTIGFIYALTQALSLSSVSWQQALITFLGGLAVVTVIALVVNGIAARKSARLLSPSLGSTQSNFSTD